MEEPCVGGNGMPGRELDDVAGNNVPDIDDAQAPATDDDRPRDAEMQERFHRPPRAELGDEADDRVEKQDGGDGRRVDVVTHRNRDDRGGGEQQDDDARQLIAENMPGGGGLRAVEAIGAKPDETSSRLVIGQPRGVACEPRDDVGRVQCMRRVASATRFDSRATL